MGDSTKIYYEAIDHYHSCSEEGTNISDIWYHTLNNKGRVYSMEELINGLAPGSRVSADVYDFNFYVDPTVLDLDNPTTKLLVELGQNNFGSPLKDVDVAGRKFSSKFISAIVVGTEIINALKNLGIHRPRIMEIGAGVGFLLQVLRQYYGHKATFFAVDLPETLLIQEWLLRNWFPTAKHAYKASRNEVAFVEGGLNFINCDVLSTQDTPLDLVINMDSFQEMHKEASDAYLIYAGKNLVNGGFFYFENHFGHSVDSVDEPTEYDIGPAFNVISADLCLQADTLHSYEALRLWLQKTRGTENTETRRYVLRILWNGFNSGIVPRDKKLVQELSTLPRRVPLNLCSNAAATILFKHGVHLDQGEVDRLREDPHIDSSLFLQSYIPKVSCPNDTRPTVRDFLETMWGAQSAVNTLMNQIVAAADRWNVSRAKEEVNGICRELLTSVGVQGNSEFKAANVACFLLPLGEKSAGRDLLLNSASRSKQAYWLIRFARLLCLYGFYRESSTVLDQLNDLRSLAPIYLAVLAETRQTNGDNEQAQRIIVGLLDRGDRLTHIELLALARACALMNYPSLGGQAFTWMMQRRAEGAWEHAALEFLQFALVAFSDTTSKEFAAGCLRILNLNFQHPRTKILAGLVKYSLGEPDVGREIVSRALDELPMDYYSRGWAGLTLMKAGLLEMAKQCLQQSLALRPANFMHCEFIGNVYFYSGHWQDASEPFDRGLKIIPYVRHLRARKLYCDLPDAYKQAGVFSDPVGLSMVFQLHHDFYSDILPSHKPRFRFLNHGGGAVHQSARR